ncbi:hypothetical protein Poly30_29000 [Planctomycetes bacterium Poly30]|uniref:HEAT repeat protein n=1 Tax=Saltatorellus ferox TaxID=2528018 RepID=A0A518ETF8_9BACT|nr:hypothetical protein Poly30_29000 [Planctomycetes bacterium Poly30]
MGLVVALALLGGVVFFAWQKSSSVGTDSPKTLTIEELYRQDNRLRPVLAECQFDGVFNADTTDIPAILASKLDAGAQLEPQRRARTDLAAMGDEAAEALRRVFDSAMGDKWRNGVVKNVLGVCALSESDFGIPIAMDGLRHSAPDVRGEALLVLSQHPRKEYYDAIEAVLPGFKLEVHLERAMRGLHACDPERFTRGVEGWIEIAGRRNGFIASVLVDTALPLAARSRDPKIAERFLELEAETDGLMHRHRSYLLAPSAALGNETSIQRLKDQLASDEPQVRFHTFQALEAAGRVDDGYVLVETGVTPSERATALGTLLDTSYDAKRTAEQVADVIALARRSLQDEAPEVREVALRGLVKRGDGEGLAHLMQLLQGDLEERALATRAMRDMLGDQPEAADQARSVLIAQWDNEVTGSQRPEVMISLLTALGAVPGEATGLFLADTAELLGENSVKGTSGFHWAVGQVFNAGPEARTVLRERIKTETQPLRRIDLIQFLWQDFSDESLSILLNILEDETKSGFERLYAADRLLRMGQPERVLPVMKRIHRTSGDQVLRSGLNCLLWAWFGPAVT